MSIIPIPTIMEPVKSPMAASGLHSGVLTAVLVAAIFAIILLVFTVSVILAWFGIGCHPCIKCVKGSMMLPDPEAPIPLDHGENHSQTSSSFEASSTTTDDSSQTASTEEEASSSVTVSEISVSLVPI